MREEATLKEWKKLYEIAIKIEARRPWDIFGDMDLICLREGKKEDSIFVNILGKGGESYGITVYEGYEGLDNFLMLGMQEELKLTAEYMMFSQNNLTCYWGNKEELSEEQKKIIAEVGYESHEKNRWLYFTSYVSGYFPCNFDKNDVLRMTHYLELLDKALEAYEKSDLDVQFNKGNMYCYSIDLETKKELAKEEALPFTTYEVEKLVLTDKELVKELKKCNRNDYVLEADICYLGKPSENENYTRPLNPQICSICDAKTWQVIRADMVEPDKDASIFLAENVVDFILRFGAPKEIQVRNMILQAALENVCKVCRIKLKYMTYLPATEKFIKEMKQD